MELQKLSNLSEICEKLQSSERCKRQKTLNEIFEFFENSSSTSSNKTNLKTEEASDSGSDLVKIYDELYLHILKCYNDQYENCRLSALQVVTAAIKKLPKNDFYLQYVVSALANRIGRRELIEQSEEMRLEFLQQLHFLIDYYRSDSQGKIGDCCNDYILKSYNEIIDILLKTMTDSYPQVQREACQCVNLLSESTPSFHYRCEALAKPIFPILHHKHSQNRISAIQALYAICMYITSNSELQMQILVEISPLLMDSMPLVRLECGKVGCKLLLDLRDRYSYFDRILPLVLCCLKDESPEVRESIEKEWKKCGQQFFFENELELNKIEIIDEKPLNYPENVERPTLGCRAMVQRALRMVNVIMRETSDWKDDVRLHSLKLLYQFILHTEDKVTAKFFEIYPDLARACADNEKDVAFEAVKVSDLMGRLLKYEDWIIHGIESLENHCKLGYLKCFYSTYRASVTCNIEDIEKISKILKSNEFSHSLNPQFQEYLLKLVENLFEKLTMKSCSTENTLDKAMENLSLDPKIEIEKNLYHVVIKVMALSFDYNDKKLYQYGMKILLMLAKNKPIRNLHGEYLNSVLDTLDTLDAELDSNMEPILLLYGLIRICAFQKDYICNLQASIKSVWHNALSDAKLKIFSSISMAMLNWNEVIDLPIEESINVLKIFLDEIVAEHLIWKAGASAESMRCLAVATLCSLTQGAANEAPKVLPHYIDYFNNLLEDNNVATRCYALRCFTNFGQVELEKMKPAYYKILERLDDPCADAREWAARTISSIRPILSSDSDNELWNTLITHALSMLFIHFDGPELKLRTYVRESLVIIGQKYPVLFEKKYQEQLKHCTNKDELIELQIEITKNV